VVPFEVKFTLAVTSGSDSLIEAHWDFDADGLPDATGFAVSHVFTEAVSHEVAAEIETAANGVVTRLAAVEAYSALMSLTFDDGQESIYSLAYPLFTSRGVAATVYVVPTWMNGGWYLSWDNLTELYEAGWDIGSHTLTHKNLTQVDSLTLHFELSESRAQLQARGFPARHFSVPFGACSWTVIDAARQYYESCRGWKGLNPRLEETDPYLLTWDVTANFRPLDYYTGQIDSVITYGGWYILNNHIVSLDCYSVTTCVTRQMLSDVIDYALEQRVKILTIDQALQSRFLGADADDPPGTDRPAPVLLELAIGQGSVAAFPVTVRFGVSGRTDADLSIFDVAGRVVRNLTHLTGEGRGSAAWDGRNDDGAPVAAGCYFCVLATADNRLVAKKLVVVR
jgi:peptidoglycan/xylan/chitin deacetylase (PgdA/CDA1 family)